MIESIFPILMGIIVLGLLRSGRLSLDLSGILITVLVFILLVTTNQSVLLTFSQLLSIGHPTLAVIGVTIGLLLVIVIVLTVMINDGRNRQAALLQRIAMIEISLKELKK